MFTSTNFGTNGRLGNQLFQYAALRALSVVKAGVTYLPPPAQNPNDPGYSAHRMYLFNAKSIYSDVNSLKSNIRNVFKEKQFNYDKDFFDLPYFTDISGYFQSEKYFKDVEYIIRKELQFIDQIKYKTDEIFNSLNLDKNRSTTSIHVRRSDYLMLQNHHPVCTKEYFQKAKSMFSNTTFLIFSDDPKWCQENLTGDGSIVINTGADFFDLSLMSRCDNNIICNSSFSWWAAWLNSNKNKKVIAPEKWFGPSYASHDTSDLIPDEWTKLCI